MLELVQIDRGIPIPPPRQRSDYKRGPMRIRWAEMQIGDSIFLPGKTRAQANTAANPGRIHGMSFAVREVEGGARIWRVG